MTSVHVGRVHSRFRSAVPLPAGRVQDWVDALAAQDPATLLGAGTAALGEDEWLLVRRLSLQSQWAEDCPAVEVGARWGLALQAALSQALQAAGRDGAAAVHYRHRTEAIADLLYRSALGDSGRQWAWARMGLLPDAAARSPLPAGQALAAGVATLLRDPAAAAHIWPVLARLMAAEPDCAALSAVLRALPLADWTALLRASRRTSPYVADRPDDMARTAQVPAVPGGPAAPFVAWAQARPDLVAARGDVLAVLLCALTWPGPPPSLGEGARRRAGARVWITPALTAAARRGSVRGATGTAAQAGGAGTNPDAAPSSQAVDCGPMVTFTPSTPAGRAIDTAPDIATRPDDAAPLPPLPANAAPWQSTAWAGALFWLAQLPRSGLLAGPGAPLPAVPAGLLRALVQALGVPAEDPVAEAFCGGPATLQPLPLPGHVERAAAQVQQWADWLDSAAPDLAPPRLLSICRRPGRLRAEPGWVELRLPLAGVHTAVRRLGLDLDPGWLPWWGGVLVIRYDD